MNLKYKGNSASNFCSVKIFFLLLHPATAALYCFKLLEATWGGPVWFTAPLLVLLIEQEIKAELPFISCG